MTGGCGRHWYERPGHANEISFGSGGGRSTTCRQEEELFFKTTKKTDRPGGEPNQSKPLSFLSACVRCISHDTLTGWLFAHPNDLALECMKRTTTGVSRIELFVVMFSLLFFVRYRRCAHLLPAVVTFGPRPMRCFLFLSSGTSAHPNTPAFSPSLPFPFA